MIQVFHVVIRRLAADVLKVPRLPFTGLTTAEARDVYKGEHPDFMFKKVADVSTDDLDVAYELTNTIHGYWVTYNGSRLTAYGARLRSTSVGDMMIDAAGKRHVVASIGFEEF